MEIIDKNGEANIAYLISGIEGDMGQSTRLGLIQQADGDIVLSLTDSETGCRLDIEFCASGSRGGINPMILRGLQNIVSCLVDGEKTQAIPPYSSCHRPSRSLELYRKVLSVLARQQNRFIPLDEILRNKEVLLCYTPRYFVVYTKPPNIKRARQAIRSAISHLRAKGYIIKCSRGSGQTAYQYLGR